MNKTLSILFCFFLTTHFAQIKSVTLSGKVADSTSNEAIPFAKVVLKTETNVFVAGTICNDEGRFSIANIATNSYILEVSTAGFSTQSYPIFIGSLSEFIEIPTITLNEIETAIEEVIVVGKQDLISSKLDKKVFSLDDNISQSGGSVLQSMQNLPGITIQDGKVQLRGSDKVTVLIDGKQTALTGIGGQSGLDNIPASAIEKIEIINNPNAKYDANGNAGIINIIYKKNKQEGFNGKIGLAGGLGSLWIRKENLPSVREQAQFTPKINPSISLNYRKNKVNLFFQGDYLYTQTLNKHEFVTRTYADGTVINQETNRNRNTQFTTLKTGIDWTINDQNSITISGLFGTEKILDHGDEVFFDAHFSNRLRLWQFLEDELKTTAMATVAFQHKFKQAGHVLNIGINTTFHREDEKYYFDNILPTYSGKDAFKLLSDEKVADFNLDYVRPLKYGKIEGGMKYRWRAIPTNMQFFPGLNSPLDSSAGGTAVYRESIPAFYGNYVFENKKIEAEIGLRYELVHLKYEVNPNHPTYKSNGYSYSQPFPNVRFAYKLSATSKLSLFFNRRVDRPNEVDIRIFPKYDDAEIIKVGNPALRPQFTNTYELAYKTSWKTGYFYSAAYHKAANGTITRLASTEPNSTLIYSIFENAKKSYTTGLEMVVSEEISKLFSFTFNMNVYHNQIDAFQVTVLYPSPGIVSVQQQAIYSGNMKFNTLFHLPKNFTLQTTASYLAPDIVPQGKISARFSFDFGLKKAIQKNKGELFVNMTDVAGTLRLKKTIVGTNFSYISTDYYETQVIRFGYSYKF